MRGFQEVSLRKCSMKQIGHRPPVVMRNYNVFSNFFYFANTEYVRAPVPPEAEIVIEPVLVP